MNMTDELDIDKQYEQIFGKKEHPNIFSPDDEEYNNLRQKICESKREFNHLKIFPFSGIKLSTYEDFTRTQIVNEAQKKGHRIFYIRQYKNDKMHVYAAGYFDTKTSTFAVLHDSFFQYSQYFTHLISSISNPGKRVIFRDNFSACRNIVRQSRLMHYDSASLAASFYLGKKSDFRAWKDDRGKTLDAYFLRYKASNIEELEDKTFPDYTEPEHVVPEKAVPQPLNDKQSCSSKEEIGTHLFCIEIAKNRKALGYYNKEDNLFYICKNSFISISETKEYRDTDSSVARKRFLSEACEWNRAWESYMTIKEAKCRSAAAAACYVLGKTVTHSEWIDKDGKRLSDCYPEIFKSEEDKQHSTNQSDSLSHLFYITKDNGRLRSCKVIGAYDTKTRKFILKKDSLLCLDCAPSFYSTYSGTSRLIFLNQYCSKENEGYRLKQDVPFDSPSTPACFALGRSANGWLEWKDQNGVTLDTIYRQAN